MSDDVHDARLLAGAAGVLATVGSAVSGPAGLGFLLTPIDTPLWFVLSAVALPTGDLLRVIRSFINGFGPKGRSRGGE